MGNEGCGSGYSGGSIAAFGYLGFPQRRGFSFYPSGSGLHEPTDGNLFVPRQGHGMPEFSPIARYEGNSKDLTAFNAAAKYTGSIDDRVSGNYTRRREEAPIKKKPYLLAPEMMDYQ